MKVLQINSVCGQGSTGRIAADIQNLLAKQGHECLFAYGRGTAPSGINSLRIGTDFDNYLHAAATRIFDNHGFSSTDATKEFIKKVKEYNPDLIHMHNLHGYYVNVDLLFNYLQEANKSIVWTLHDCWALTGHCAHFDYIGCNKWKKGCYDCQQKDVYPASLVFDNSERNYEKKKELFTSVRKMVIVTPSKWLSKIVDKSFLSSYPLQVINNGIDLEIFRHIANDFRQRYELHGKIIILGVANIWALKKGLDDFIDLAKYIDNNKFKIVMVGVTGKQLKTMPKNILGIERTNNVLELAQIYTAADVFFNPTYEEVLGMTNLEALACGTPVITYNSGGSPECITTDSGYIIGKGEWKLVPEIINNMKNIKYETLRNEALLFDKNKKYTEYIDLYQKMLNV
ncbi:MAG: glycosyltransferase [Negativicutes bacterium]|nr:glycosyltransferase [Negativicutes bacterium]